MARYRLERLDPLAQGLHLSEQRSGVARTIVELQLEQFDARPQLAGVGLGFSFVPVTIAALQGVEHRDAGVASGLINTSQQIGGALGVAALVTVATSITEDAVADGTAPPQAAVDGFSVAFGITSALAVVGIIATLALIRTGRVDAEQVAGEELADPAAELG